MDPDEHPFSSRIFIKQRLLLSSLIFGDTLAPARIDS